MVAQNGWDWDFGYGAHVAEDYGVTKIPVTIFIDASGSVAFHQVGYMEKEAFVAQLEQLLPAS
jgi:thioredoxin-related protein